MTTQRRVVTREELYAAVWTTPLSRLAKEYGISDVGIAKICKKLGVPRPNRGYWAKRKAGLSKHPPALTPGHPINEVEIYPPYVDSQEREALRAIKAVIEKNLQIVVPKRLKKPHTLTVMTQETLDVSKPNNHGLIYCSPPHGYDLAISPGLRARALLMMDTLVKALESCNVTVRLDSDLKRMYVGNKEDEVRFCLRESYKQTRMAPPPRKKGDHLYSYSPKYSYTPTGSLSIRIEKYLGKGVLTHWEDKKAPIEDRLAEIVNGLLLACELQKEKRLQREMERRRWNEKEQQQREVAMHAKIELEAAEALIREAKQWQAWGVVEQYLLRIDKQVKDCHIDLSADGVVWLKSSWERLEKNRPLGRRLDILSRGDVARTKTV